MHIYISLFIVFIGDQCSSASLGHDDIDVVDTKAKSDKREVEGRVITGDACEYIMLCDIIKNAGCDDGSKFVVKQKTGVRKQFLILNGSPVLGFVKKKTKFTSCTSYTQVTSNVDCKAISGLSGVDLSSASSNTSSSFFRSMFKNIMEEFGDIEIIEDIPIAQPRAAGRVIKGDDCEYIKICDVTNNTGCSDGNKFVIQQQSGVRKQFLILNGEPVVGFVTKKKKFTSCSSYTEVTANVDCKEVSGLANVDLSSSSNTSSSTSSPSNSSEAGQVKDEDRNKCRCGVKRESRIVGGQTAEPGEYPWMAGLMQGGSFFCGGSLIAGQWVLTAAHCMDGVQVHRVKVVLGEHDRSVKGETDNRQVVAISESFVHKQFDFDTFNNDICLLRLETSVNLDYFTPACLPSSRLDQDSLSVWITGWGVLGENTWASPDKLQELNLRTITRSKCEAMFQKAGYDYAVTGVMLCAGGEKGKDGCQGDSGGPLTQETGGQHSLVGVVSWGEGCAKAGLPGVYTNVGAMKNWVDNIIRQNGGAQYCHDG